MLKAAWLALFSILMASIGTTAAIGATKPSTSKAPAKSTAPSKPAVPATISSPNRPALAPAPEPASPPYVFPATGDLTNNDLEQYGFKVLLFEPKDQFDAPPDTSALAGRTFTLTTKANFTYDTQSHVLKFSIYPSTWTSASLLKAPNIYDYNSIEGFSVRSISVPVRTYEGTNGFGAKAVIKETHTDSVGIAHFSKSYPFQKREGFPDPKSGERYFSAYQSSLMLEPDAARQLTQNIVLVVKGAIDRLPDGRSIICGSHYLEPKISSPYEDSGKNCLFAATVSSIAIVDKATGNTVTEWH